MDDLYPQNECPAVKAGDPVKEVIYTISSGRLGAAAVFERKKIVGIITDGDLRRMLEGGRPLKDMKAKDIMTHDPMTVPAGMMAVDALQLMKVGSKWKLFIPSDLAYGERGSPPKIAPDSVLIFDIELLSIEK